MPINVGIFTAFAGIPKTLPRMKELGFKNISIHSGPKEFMNAEYAGIIRQAVADTGVAITTMWCGLGGPNVWDFVEGPLTIGFVPVEYRAMRVQAMAECIEFAHMAGIPYCATHAGFIPENLNDPVYTGMIAALRPLVRMCKRYDMKLLFETGQETPVTLLRTIEDLGGEGVGVNFDTGNLILYGKGAPVDALDVFGKYVFDFHAKDGLYPTNGRQLGHEVQIGQGKVNFPALIKKLKEIGYSGPMTIEREISGDQQMIDIMASKKWLEELIAAE